MLRYYLVFCLVRAVQCYCCTVFAGKCDLVVDLCFFLFTVVWLLFFVSYFEVPYMYQWCGGGRFLGVFTDICRFDLVFVNNIYILIQENRRKYRYLTFLLVS